MRHWLLIFVILLITETAKADWTVDWSRRFKSEPRADVGGSTSPEPIESDKSIFDKVFSSSAAEEPAQEIVIMQTENGFVPKRVQVRQGFTYKIDVVNVNEKERNVSFVLDAFSEHHATYYGKIKSFTIRPQQDGVYSFQSPETAFQGQLVVLPSDMPRSGKEIQLHSEPSMMSPELRKPTSQQPEAQSLQSMPE